MRPSTSLLVPSVLTAVAVLAGAGIAPAAADPGYLAQRAYKEGLEHYRRGAHDQALEACRRSYALVASPSSQLCVARSLRNLGRRVEAVTAYELAIDAGADAPRYQTALTQARAERDALLAQLGTIALTVAPRPRGLVIRLDGQPVEPAMLGLPILVEPGTRRLAATADGFVSVDRTVEVEAGGRAEVSLALTERKPTRARRPRPAPPPAAAAVRVRVDPGRGLRRTSYALGGLGVTTLIASGVAGYLAVQQHDEVVAACTPVCRRDVDADVTRGRRLQLATNVGVTVGAVALVAGVGLRWLAPSPRWRLTPMVEGRGGGSVHLSTHF